MREVTTMRSYSEVEFVNPLASIAHMPLLRRLLVCPCSLITSIIINVIRRAPHDSTGARSQVAKSDAL